MSGIRLDRSDDGVMLVTLDRPARRNAVTLAMWTGLARAYRDFAEDPGVRTVILVGAGEHFCAGADIAEFEELRRDAEAALRYDAAVDECCEAIEALPCPSIAAISGFCMGGGVGLALAHDFRIAAPGATLAITAARLGIVYGSRETRNLLLTVGFARAKRILFTAERLSAGAAAAAGLVDDVAEAPLEAAHALAATMARNAPLSLAGSKRLLSALARRDVDDALVRSLMAAAMDSEDAREGRLAFSERREPAFRGR